MRLVEGLRPFGWRIHSHEGSIVAPAEELFVRYDTTLIRNHRQCDRDSGTTAHGDSR